MNEQVPSKLSFLNYLNPFKVIPALFRAVREAKNAKDKNFFEKLNIFASTFKKEVRGIKKEKEKTTAEADAKVAGNIKEKLQGAEKELGLGKLSGNDKELADVVLGTTVSSFGMLGSAQQAHADSAREKLKDSIDGKNETLTADETAAFAGGTLMTLKRLKARYNTPAKFKAMLEKVAKISGNSRYPLRKMLRFDVLSVMEMPMSEAKDFMSKYMGISIGVTDAFAFIGIGGGGVATQGKEVIARQTKR